MVEEITHINNCIIESVVNSTILICNKKTSQHMIFTFMKDFKTARHNCKV